MKNADRINFYLSGLRQPGRNPAPTTQPAAAEATDIRAPGAATGVPTPQTGGEVAANGGNQPAAAPADVQPSTGVSFRDALLATEAGQELLGLDQAQLHRLLRQLDHSRRLTGDRADPPPELTRKKQRQLIAGLVLAGLIIAAQATAVVWLYQRAEMLLGRPLSPALLLTAAAGDLTVTFRPSASAGDVGVLLRELRLQIVEGPDAGGRYVLRPAADDDNTHALNALRDRRDLVYSAETTY